MTDDAQPAATEAAQRVIDEGGSWQYGAEDITIAPRVRAATRAE